MHGADREDLRNRHVAPKGTAVALVDLLRSHPALGSVDLAPVIAAVEAAMDCAAHCSACADACLSEEMDMSSCIRTCRDCEEICRATAAILSRPSPGGQAWRSVVEACADMCRECADECSSHEDEHCRVCAEACRSCEQACRALLAADVA